MMSMSMSAGAAMYLRPAGTATSAGTGTSTGTGASTGTGTGLGASSNPISAAFAAAAPAAPGAAPGGFRGPLASGPSWCRGLNNPTYTGYEIQPETDMAKCQTKCANDAKCVAFESNGKNCWYYGGVETQMPAPADHQGHQCYVKIK